MLISYFRQGAEGCVREGPAAGSLFWTREETAGPAQKQFLLDYEEDRLCVVRHVRDRGSIGGRRLWPSADPEYSDDCA